ncbi:bZIP transcription factor [Sporobolomyces salmoneus]|uniref:bZIP transcription factor n=1 Tax=Sporobolomyces salmoneus TaxID=183962 RepID=UPI0031762B96
MTKPIMNQYTEQFFANEQQSLSKFDEAAADLTSFLDFSSFDPAAPTAKGHDTLPPLEVNPTTGSFDAAFAYASNRSPLRPVDDSLLDSPLGLELSPADSIFTTSSISGSPYDLDMSINDFGGGGDSSPLFGTDSYSGSPAVGTSDLVFPSFSHLSATTSSSSAAGTPGMITTAELPSLFAALPLVAAHELADIKPIIPTSAFSAPPPHQSLARHESTESVPFSFEDFIGESQPQPEEIVPVPTVVAEEQEEEEPTTSTRSSKRKSVAEIKREAAAKVAEKEFSQDKHLGFRNTKKKMVDYDAPTLPKNYLTESATSKKRSGSTKVAQSVAKRSRTARNVSASPALAALPQTQATPLDADQLDEEQLSQIELKRRQNTLAARKSRMRKAETFKMLSDEVEKLKQLNEALMAENQELKRRLGQ